MKNIYIELSTRLTDHGIINGGDWEDWAYFATGVIFALLGIYLVWLYFKYKPTYEASKAAVEDRSAWSFVGFWGRYKGQIIIFGASVLLLIGLGFILMGGLGMVPQGYTSY